jgi:hypothetical protein
VLFYYSHTIRVHHHSVALRQAGLFAAAVCVAGTFALLACKERAEFSHLPRQYEPSAQDLPIPDVPLLVMGTTSAAENVVGGMSDEESEWPWSDEHPRFRCFLRDRGPWQFILQFFATNDTLKDTGPVTVTVSINGAPFSKFLVEKAGIARYEHDVPAENPLSGRADIDLTINPFWTSTDGTRLGILIHSIGFRRKSE